MLERIKKQVIENEFLNEVRKRMFFNETAYNDLVSTLNELSVIMEGEQKIDKELALYLYSIPQMIRYAYDSFDKVNDKNEMAMKLEDAWIELDALVIDVLS